MAERQALADDALALAADKVSVWGRTLGARRALRKNPTMTGGFVILIVISLMATFSAQITTKSATRLFPQERLQAPSSEHWFGTDQLGRDVYSRTVYGSRISLLVGAVVAFVSVTGGAFFGVVAGYSKTLDKIIMRFADGLMSFPSLLLAIALVAVMGTGILNVMLAISVVQIPSITRVVRSSVLSLREREFVEAARAIGASPVRIVFRHVLPNTIAALLVYGTLTFALAILSEAGLSFLGAGIPLETPSWGNGMGQGRDYARQAFWVIFYPGLFLSITILGVNLIGDGLRDALDPRISRRA
ncbi:MAG: ABC transporter permease [Chloroflexi bacterium]|nr:ABC transporter permease [Chloroflexota bacterium]